MSKITIEDLKRNKEALLGIFQKHNVVNPGIFGQLVNRGYDFGADISFLVEFQRPIDPVDKAALELDIQRLLTNDEGSDDDDLHINIATLRDLEESVRTRKITEAQKNEIISTANAHPLKQTLEEELVASCHHSGLFTPITSVEMVKRASITAEGNPQAGTLHLQFTGLSSKIVAVILADPEILKKISKVVNEIDDEKLVRTRDHLNF